MKHPIYLESSPKQAKQSTLLRFASYVLTFLLGAIATGLLLPLAFWCMTYVVPWYIGVLLYFLLLPLVLNGAAIFAVYRQWSQRASIVLVLASFLGIPIGFYIIVGLIMHEPYLLESLRQNRSLIAFIKDNSKLLQLIYWDWYLGVSTIYFWLVMRKSQPKFVLRPSIQRVVDRYWAYFKSQIA